MPPGCSLRSKAAFEHFVAGILEIGGVVGPEDGGEAQRARGVEGLGGVVAAGRPEVLDRLPGQAAQGLVGEAEFGDGGGQRERREPHMVVGVVADLVALLHHVRARSRDRRGRCGQSRRRWP